MKDGNKMFGSKRVLLHNAIIILILSGSLFLSSCIKDILDIDIQSIKIKLDGWEPDLAVPLVHANVSILDFTKVKSIDSSFKVYDDYFVSLLYNSTKIVEYTSSYLNIPNQSFRMGPLSYSTSGNDSIRVTTNIYFDENKDYQWTFTNSEEINKIILKSGELKINFTSDFTRSGKIQIDIPGLKLGGVDFVKIVNFTQTAHNPVTIKENINLTGYELDLSKGNTAHNTLNIRYRVTLDNNLLYIHQTDNINFKLDFENLNFKYIEGYLGQRQTVYNLDSIYIGVFDNSSAGKISFRDPKLKLYFNNSVGIPARFENPTISGSNKKHINYNLQGDFINNPINIDYPSVSQAGQLIQTVLIADTTNSNIANFINFGPVYTGNTFTLKTNATGKTYNNFATDSSKLQINAEIEIPIYGRTEYWGTTITQQFKSIDPSIIEYLQFNILAENQFPIDAYLQVFFADSLGNILDSLISTDGYIIKSGEIDDNGKMISPGVSLSKIIFPKDRIDNLADAKEIIYRVAVVTGNKGQTDVKMYANSRIDIKLSMRAKLKVF